MFNNKTIVYLSSLLPERYPEFTKKLLAIFRDEEIEVVFLSGTKDIWCRDFMPVQLSKDRFVQFKFKPEYLVGFVERQTNPEDIRPKLNAAIYHSKLKIDGGNIIRYGRTAILTNKIFSDNPGYRNRKSTLVQQITEDLDVDKLVIIPRDTSDISGHADGMVRLIFDNTVIMNDYLASDGYSPAFARESVRVLTLQGVCIAGTLPYRAFNRKNRDGDFTAIGCYINYL